MKTTFLGRSSVSGYMTEARAEVCVDAAACRAERYPGAKESKMNGSRYESTISIISIKEYNLSIEE